MKNNLWLYANVNEQRSAAESLTLFGAEIFKSARLVKYIKDLKKIKSDLDNGLTNSTETTISDFAFEYLIDCIRILIFFENYMKAKLIVRDYCVHVINMDYPNFRDLGKRQRNQPISLKDIQNIKTFNCDLANKVITHSALKETTIGMGELLKPKYLEIYNIDKTLISIITNFKQYRNKLHLNSSIEFNLSDQLILNIEILDDFVNQIFKAKINL